MTTTTKSALAELERLEREQHKAHKVASELAREHFGKRKRLDGHLDEAGLLDERRRLEFRDPAQFAPDGSAKGAEAKAIEKEINAIGDLAPLAREIEHARLLEAKAKGDADEFAREHLTAILEELRPKAEAVADAANAAAAAFGKACGEYIAFNGRVAGLLGKVPGANTRVPGLDAAAEHQRTVKAVDLPAPVPR